MKRNQGSCRLTFDAHVVQQAVREVNEEMAKNRHEQGKVNRRVGFLGKQRNEESQDNDNNTNESKHGKDVEPNAVLRRHRSKQIGFQRVSGVRHNLLYI